MNENSMDFVRNLGLGKTSTLSDHRPIYLHLSLSKVQKGWGFWRLNGELLNDPIFVYGCNKIIRKCIVRYSEQYKTCKITEYPTDQELALVPPEISYILL